MEIAGLDIERRVLQIERKLHQTLLRRLEGFDGLFLGRRSAGDEWRAGLWAVEDVGENTVLSRSGVVVGHHVGGGLDDVVDDVEDLDFESLDLTLDLRVWCWGSEGRAGEGESCGNDGGLHFEVVLLLLVVFGGCGRMLLWE